MPIQPQRNPNIPYLRNYTPYQYGPSIVVCDLVEDMVSYSLKPNNLTLFKYYVGPEQLPSYTLNVKNLTEETILGISVTYDSNTFMIKGLERDKATNPVKTLINPTSQTKFLIELNKEYLNGRSDYESLNSKIVLSVTNLRNGRLAIKSSATPIISQTALPDVITVQ